MKSANALCNYVALHILLQSHVVLCIDTFRDHQLADILVILTFTAIAGHPIYTVTLYLDRTSEVNIHLQSSFFVSRTRIHYLELQLYFERACK